MQFQLPIHIKSLSLPITYSDKILLIGSCFTEHIGDCLANTKFNTLQNPNGILFNPLSACSSLISYIQNKQYNEEELFYLNECWHSWQHHSRFSNPDKEACLQNINLSQQTAHHFLAEADWLMITLGSAFVYKLAETNEPVANCHRAVAQTFDKHLCSNNEIIAAFDNTIHRLFNFNQKIKIIFTISPVRHIRDGVVDNNRSKARLIEAVHHLINKFEKLYYFPAYELVIDVLRDYRFFDIDLVHPNYAATEFVLEKFTESCMNEENRQLMEEIKKIMIAKNHKAFNPQSQQHKQFLQRFYAKTLELQERYSGLNFDEELKYFAG